MAFAAVANRVVVSALAFSLLIGWASASEAGTQYYMGYECQRDAGGLFSLSDYGAHNSSSSSELSIYCPIEVSAAGVNTLVSFSLLVSVFDRDPIRDVSCVLRSHPSGGATTGNIQMRSSSGFSSAVQSLSFSQTTNRYAQMQCSIPRHNATNGFSHVTSYRVIDNQP